MFGGVAKLMADLQLGPDVMPASRRAVAGEADGESAGKHAAAVTKAHEHIIAHRPRAVGILEMGVALAVLRLGHHVLEDALAAVVMARMIEVHNALPFHVRLTGEDVNLNSVAGLAAGENGGKNHRDEKGDSHAGNLPAQIKRAQGKIPVPLGD